MGDAFLLGAGFSHAVSDKMPLVKDLAEIIADMGKLPARLLAHQNFELLLSYLQTDQPFLEDIENLENKALFHTLTLRLASFLWARQYSAMDSKPQWLTAPTEGPRTVGLIQIWESQRSSVVTLNYDTFIEAAIEGPPRAYREVYPFTIEPSDSYSPGIHFLRPRSSFRLYKLHGSLNWLYSGERAPWIQWPEDLMMVGRWVNKADDPGKHQSDFSEILKNRPGLRPLIVPPSFGKSPYFSNIMIQETWRETRKDLADSEKLFILGYSMPNADIQVRTLIAETMGGKTLVPVNNSHEPDIMLRNLRKMFPSCQIDHSWLEKDVKDWAKAYIQNATKE